MYPAAISFKSGSLPVFSFVFTSFSLHHGNFMESVDVTIEFVAPISLHTCFVRILHLQIHAPRLPVTRRKRISEHFKQQKHVDFESSESRFFSFLRRGHFEIFWTNLNRALWENSAN